ncbi:hypothetical protein V6N12_038761 [Hibiscus sabdariffa]|uniref:Uncharacterized protein n=1 Tax=Hibiscus sabdariffa TaxID=183260 RepID=A0ABR2CCS5_9ROSI
MEKPKRKERKKPKASAQQRPAQAENISSRYFTAGDSCKSAADFPARKQLAVKSVSEPRLPSHWKTADISLEIDMASARYAIVAARSRWEEHGFHFDDNLPNYGLEQFLYNRLNELGWFRLARQPGRANYNWVIEFYANNAAGEDFSTV